jgi:hypothetical protein
MPPESAEIFLEASTPGAWVTAPPSLREQVMFELMTPANAIAAVQHLLNLVAGRSIPERKSLVVMADERRVWARS